MADIEYIENQRQLLKIYRDNLQHYLEQAALHGGISYASIATNNGITENRSQIRRIKALLREQGVEVEDWPDDELSEAKLPTTSVSVPSVAAPSTAEAKLPPTPVSVPSAAAPGTEQNLVVPPSVPTAAHSGTWAISLAQRWVLVSEAI